MNTDVQGWVVLLGEDWMRSTGAWRSGPRSAVIEHTEDWYTVRLPDPKFTGIPVRTQLVALEVHGLGPPVVVPLDVPRLTRSVDDEIEITNVRFPADWVDPTMTALG